MHSHFDSCVSCSDEVILKCLCEWMWDIAQRSKSLCPVLGGCLTHTEHFVSFTHFILFVKLAEIPLIIC